MMIVWAVLLVVTQVSTSVSVHNISKRTADWTKCAGCRTEICHDKYEMFEGHTACLKKSPYANPVVLTQGDRNAILEYHNILRASVSPPAANMLKMYWDNELEMLATRWAQACKKDEYGKFYHDTVRFIPGRIEVGQNIGTGFDTFREAIDAWNIENKTYAAYQDHPIEFPDELQIMGHHTQIVWAETGLLGCAASVCENTPLFVCNYAPPGNLLPFFSPYDVGTKRGQACLSRSPNGLCDCKGIVCENAAIFDIKSCTCKCRFPSNVGTKCEMDCSYNDFNLCGKITGFKPESCGTAFTNYACPSMCGHCPCVAANYFPLACSVSESTSVNRLASTMAKIRCLVVLQLIIWLSVN